MNINFEYYRIFYYVAKYCNFTFSTMLHSIKVLPELQRHCTITSQISQGA